MKRISLHVSGKSRHREIASNSLRDNPINDLIESIVGESDALFCNKRSFVGVIVSGNQTPSSAAPPTGV